MGITLSSTLSFKAKDSSVSFPDTLFPHSLFYPPHCGIPSNFVYPISLPVSTLTGQIA